MLDGNSMSEEFEVLSPPNSTYSELSNKYYYFRGILTYKQFKGWSYEAIIQHILKQHFISFNGNPLDPKQWIKHQGHGVDLITEDLLIESKAIYRYRFSSGNVKHDLLPRFQKVKDNKLKVMLTNNKSLVTRPAIRLMNEEGILLWNIQDLLKYYKIKSIMIIRFFIRLKRSSNIPSFTSIYNTIKHDNSDHSDHDNHTTFYVCSTREDLYFSYSNGQKYYKTRLKESNNQTSLVNSNEISSGYSKPITFKENEHSKEDSIENWYWSWIAENINNYDYEMIFQFCIECGNMTFQDIAIKLLRHGYKLGDWTPPVGWVTRVLLIDGFVKGYLEILSKTLTIPCCKYCTRFKKCRIMNDVKRLKCLKKRVFLHKKYEENYNNEDREYSITLFNDSFSEEDFKEFWNRVRIGEFKDLIKPYNNGDLLYYINGDG